ncbi:hypothetical protein PPL_09166 [Heterostelium album PN500]|uniref:Uncharacterized protein n=1 Tax=Heterostelium pallidum (strain ATCC 26659 / Pp 5 / PN500) TaxID=670386 RepID=D3BKT4_HETP5|nr:hypothetical protein PPL_09166 [Heterostelium album PN500]EFA78514.1 hypothetical protein PPL_09166 [Heterostelium album PN500]|eukprot:XP_020430638.1 hypothetical protein PPL_09166 [Heterostelium album PN500]
MTINSPVLAGNWLFWSTFEEFVTPTFVLQKYNGPIWWTEKYRILMMIEGCNNNGYQIAFSSTREDIVGNWEIIIAVYQDKVEKTGLSQFSESYLLNLMKKLAKKMAKLEELNSKRLKLSGDSAITVPQPSSSPTTTTSFTTTTTTNEQHESSSSSSSPNNSFNNLSISSSYNFVMPSNMAIVSTMNEANEKSSIKLGNQRRIATLFKALYHIDPITILERTYAKKYEDDEWVEWADERTGMRPIHIAVEKMDIALIKRPGLVTATLCFVRGQSRHLSPADRTGQCSGALNLQGRHAATPLFGATLVREGTIRKIPTDSPAAA